MGYKEEEDGQSLGKTTFLESRLERIEGQIAEAAFVYHSEEDESDDT